MPDGFIRATTKAASKLEFKDFLILGALSAILSKTFRDKRKKKRERAKIKLTGISVTTRKEKAKRIRSRIKSETR